MEPELNYADVSRVPLIGMACFVLPVFGWLVWVFRPWGPLPAHWMFWGLFGMALAGLLLTAWSLYSLLPRRPILATCPEGVYLGLWVRRGVPWRNVADVRLTEIQLTGGLRKRWSAGRPYDQELIIDLRDPDDLLFEDGPHRFVHRLTPGRRSIRLPMRLVSASGNDEVLAALRERWARAVPRPKA